MKTAALETTAVPTLFSLVVLLATLLAPQLTSSIAAAPQSAVNNQSAANKAGLGNEVTTFKGKLKGMQRGVIRVEKEDGTQAMVAPPDEINAFQFIAKAKPAFLRRGMMVRITGNFGPNGLPLAPIEKVTLFQSVPLQSIRGRAKQQYTPGIHSDSKQPKGRNQPVMGKLTIVGGLMNLSPQGILAVQAGKTPVQIPLTAETELEIRYNNLALAQEDDLVNVAGFYNPPNENQVKADRITITTDRVYGDTPPAAEKKRRGRKKEEDAIEKDDEMTEDMKNESVKEDDAKKVGDIQ